MSGEGKMSSDSTPKERKVRLSDETWLPYLLGKRWLSETHDGTMRALMESGFDIALLGRMSQLLAMSLDEESRDVRRLYVAARHLAYVAGQLQWDIGKVVRRYFSAKEKLADNPQAFALAQEKAYTIHCPGGTVRCKEFYFQIFHLQKGAFLILIV